MGFNKAREEHKWKQWKEAEEKKMRGLGVSEEVITKLYEYDWEIFKQERIYQERQIPDTDLVMQRGDTDTKHEIHQPINVEELIEAIDNKSLRKILMKTDMLTMRVVLMRSIGYSIEEIADYFGMKPNTISARLMRLRKKIKKFFG